VTVMADERVRYLTPEDVSEALQIPVGTLANWRSQKKGPKFYRFGGLVRYHPDDFEAWLAAQAVG